MEEPKSGQNTFNWVSKFKFSIQNVTWVPIASPSSSIPTTRTPLLTHIPFRMNIKRGESKSDLDFHQKTSWDTNTSAQRQAGGCAQARVKAFTYPGIERCQAQQCRSQRLRGRSEWLCCLLPWPRGLSLLPSGQLGRCLLSQKSGFPLQLLCQCFNCSQTVPMCSPPPPLLSYLKLQVSVMNHFLGTSCSLPLKAKSHVK